MRKLTMLNKVLVAIVAVVIAFSILVASQPSTFEIERSITIDAPPMTVFNQVNNLRRWEKWSPWATLDPKMKTSHGKVSAGVGAKMEWEGNYQVGKGKLTILKSNFPGRIVYSLEMLAPMAATNDMEFRLETKLTSKKGVPITDASTTNEPMIIQTQVWWTMSGSCNLLCRAANVIFDCQKDIGQKFDKGLQNLKVLSEKLAPAVVRLPPSPAAKKK